MQRLPAVPAGGAVHCVECGERLRWHRPLARPRSAWFAAGALILLGPALVFPMLSVHYVGNYNQFDLVQVVGRLYQSGDWFIGTFIAVITFVTPAAQSLALVLLGVLGRAAPVRLRMTLQRVVQIAEPWNMSQMFLLALLVGVAQFGNMMAIRILPGILAYGLAVAFSRMAAIEFEPADDWER